MIPTEIVCKLLPVGYDNSHWVLTNSLITSCYATRGNPQSADHTRTTQTVVARILVVKHITTESPFVMVGDVTVLVTCLVGFGMLYYSVASCSFIYICCHYLLFKNYSVVHNILIIYNVL